MHTETNPCAAKCPCRHCGGSIAFDPACAGQEGDCPHYGKKTWIDIRGSSAQADKPNGLYFPITKKAVIVLVLFAICNLAWGMVYLNERAALMKLRANNSRLQIAMGMMEKTENEFESNVQAAIDSQEIAGIYRYIPPGVSRSGGFMIDIRSDGSGLYKPLISEYWQKVTWSRKDFIVTVTRVGMFRIEGEDLIDDKGNRWERYR